jgi:hypothetical protein
MKVPKIANVEPTRVKTQNLKICKEDTAFTLVYLNNGS